MLGRQFVYHTEVGGRWSIAHFEIVGGQALRLVLRCWDEGDSHILIWLLLLGRCLVKHFDFGRLHFNGLGQGSDRRPGLGGNHWFSRGASGRLLHDDILRHLGAFGSFWDARAGDGVNRFVEV